VVAFQALLGMWTVTWLLKPIVVSGHLLGGMTTFALLAWIAWRVALNVENPFPSGEGALTAQAGSAGEGAHLKRREDFSGRGERVLFAAVLTGMILLACQIFLGGWTSSNYAALACGTDFPKCLGHWWPPVDFHQGFILWRGVGVNFEGGILDAAARSAIQIAHRFGALVVFVYLAWLAHRVARAGLRALGVALGLLLLAQVALGIGNVKLGLPLIVAVAHNGGAALLLFVMVGLLARTTVSREPPSVHRIGQASASAVDRSRSTVHR
jgi:heme a synthase